MSALRSMRRLVGLSTRFVSALGVTKLNGRVNQLEKREPETQRNVNQRGWKSAGLGVPT
jgi:hypothetical protein